MRSSDSARGSGPLIPQTMPHTCVLGNHGRIHQHIPNTQPTPDTYHLTHLHLSNHIPMFHANCGFADEVKPVYHLMHTALPTLFMTDHVMVLSTHRAKASRLQDKWQAHPRCSHDPLEQKGQRGYESNKTSLSEKVLYGSCTDLNRDIL